MKIENASKQTLYFPDGTEVKIGGEYALTAADQNNIAVMEWLEEGWIVEAKPAKASKPAEFKG